MGSDMLVLPLRMCSDMLVLPLRMGSDMLVQSLRMDSDILCIILSMHVVKNSDDGKCSCVVKLVMLPMSSCVLSSGLPSQAFEYIHYNKGIEGEEDYPYKGHVSHSKRVCMCVRWGRGERK